MENPSLKRGVLESFFGYLIQVLAAETVIVFSKTIELSLLMVLTLSIPASVNRQRLVLTHNLSFFFFASVSADFDIFSCLINMHLAGVPF